MRGRFVRVAVTFDYVRCFSLHIVTYHYFSLAITAYPRIVTDRDLPLPIITYRRNTRLGLSLLIVTHYDLSAHCC